MIHVVYKKYLLEKEDKKYLKEHKIALDLLGYILKKQYNIHLSNIEEEFIYDKYGKPYLKHYKNIHFNISHCDGFVAVGVSNDPIGIDIEKVKACKEAMMKKILTDKEYQYLQMAECKEHAFFKFWKLKESYLKWCGKGFSLNPKLVEFEFDERSILCSDISVHCEQRYIDSNCILSIVYKGKETINYESL